MGIWNPDQFDVRRSLDGFDVRRDPEREWDFGIGMDSTYGWARTNLTYGWARTNLTYGETRKGNGNLEPGRTRRTEGPRYKPWGVKLKGDF